MQKIISFFLSIVTLISGWIFGNNQNVNTVNASDIKPDTWAAVDELGRTVPSSADVGEKDETKYVGMFYWTWHTNFANSLTAKNATEILREHPEIIYDFNSSYWESEDFYPDGRPFYWNEPIWGYYRDTDEYVLRKNAELLADAGVDVIIFDCTNGTETWDESCLKLFEVFEKAKEDGVNVPKIAYILPFSSSEESTISLEHLYDEIYSKGLYEDLWFMWDGKPLILAHTKQLKITVEKEREILEFFTVRQNIAEYFCDNTSYLEKSWGWCSDYPQTKFGVSLNGDVEEMCVSVSQNAADGELVAQNAVGNVQGRSFTKGDYSYSYSYKGETVTVDKNIENSSAYGLNFQQQWDYAIECDPNFIFVDGWNEWIAGRWEEWNGTKNAFPDQFNDEYSRDIEPENGELKDNYYYQLVANIRKFKGISDKTIEENGSKIYYHYTNSTYKRDSDGWVGTHYSSDTMRNDFVKAEVKVENGYIYLTVETKDDITPYTDDAWMRVFIDTDTSGISDNWEGFEYVINRENATENTVIIEKSTGGWNFETVGSAEYTLSGNTMVYKIPVSAVGLNEDNVKFNFKLSDNMQTDGDILDFYKSGDVAPGGRFTFVY